MNVSALLVLWLQSGLVLLVALAVCILAKRRASLRVAVVRVALLATLGLGICLPWLGNREAPVVPVSWDGTIRRSAVITPPPSVDIPEVSKEAKPAAASVTPSPGSPETPNPQTPSTPLDPFLVAVGVWALGVAFLTIHLGLGYSALAHIRRSARRVEDERAQGVLADICRQASVPLPWMMESSEVGVPFVAGVFRPVIYLPKGWASSTEPEILRAVLFHEVAHVSNGDLKWTIFHRLTSIAFWPQPLLWLLKRPMVAASEELCDQQVVSGGISEERYADCLLNLRDTLKNRPAPSLGIGACSNKSSLGKRIEALLDARRSRAVKLSRRTTLLIRVGAILIAVGATMIFASPIRRISYLDPAAGWQLTPYSSKVTVLDDSGRPFTGAGQAFLVLQEAGGTDRTVDLKMEKGLVSIDAASVGKALNGTLVVKASGYGLQFANLWPASTPVKEIRLNRPVDIKGRLTLPNGGGAANVPVRVAFLIRTEGSRHQYLPLQKVDAKYSVRTTTDAQGGFILSGLPPNTDVQLDVDDPNFAMMSMEQRVTTPANGIAKLDAKLEPSVSFSGRVTREGKPVAGVKVAVQENFSQGQGMRGDWVEAITDAQGNYTLRRLAAVPYNVALDLSGKLAEEVNAPAHEGIQGKAGQTVGGLDFQLTPGGVIEGYVYDKNGKPFPYTPVGCYGPARPRSSAWVQSVNTDANGFYRLRVPPGKQVVYWMGDGRNDMIDVAIGEGGTMKLNLNLSEATRPPVEREEVPPRQFEKPANATAVASFGQGGAAYGPLRLKNGATVKLAYVQDDSLTGAHTLWRPDGTAVAHDETARSLDMSGFGRRYPERRSLFLRVDIGGIERGDYYCEVEVPHASDWTVWQTYGDRNNKSMDMASFHAPVNLAQTDMRFGVAAGPYKPYATLRPGEKSNIPMKIGPPTETYGLVGGPTPTADITLEVPPSIQHAQMDIKAFGGSGKPLQVMTISPNSEVDPKTKKHTRTFTLTGGSPNEITRVEVGLREFEWVTFRKIQLYPN